MRRLTVALIMAVGLVTAQPADALPIGVDTGPGPSPCGDTCTNWILGPFIGDDLLPDNQWLAAQFVADQAWFITSVKGWIEPFKSGEVSFRLYSDSDDGDVPGDPLLGSRKSFTLTAPAPPHGTDHL